MDGFAACDYGFALGGQPQWSEALLVSLAARILPTSEPFSGQVYDEAAELLALIDRLERRLEKRLLMRL